MPSTPKPKSLTGEVVENELITTKPFGRPRKWTDATQFAAMVEEYFDECARQRDVPTLSGLAVYLDSDRKTLLNYSKKDDFFPTIKRARARCEAVLESRALLGGLNPALAIFSLKNNYGWIDKQEIDNNINMAKPILGGLSTKQIEADAVHSDPDDV